MAENDSSSQLGSNARLQLRKDIRDNSRTRIMRRCFMTGKQCIFGSQISASKEKRNGQPDSEGATGEWSPSVFVAMQFSPNLETFYTWSLRPHLIRDYGIPESMVQRADEVRDIGYIVCEKVCRRIQEADLILADISIKNENVFYELGLAYGLERPVVLMQNTKSNEHLVGDGGSAGAYRKSLAFPSSSDGGADPVFAYPGVGELALQDQAFQGHLHFTPKHTRVSPALKIRVLRTQDPPPGDKSSGVPVRHIGDNRADIALDFADIVVGAVGVAMSEIRELARKPPASNEAWVKVIEEGIGDKEWKGFATAEPLQINNKQSFKEIANEIAEAFATIIDVTNNDCLAYFWLGYCHARGLNAIPVCRRTSPDEAGRVEQQRRLAFDIHALWYAEYVESEPDKFKKEIREILEHLMTRDLPHREKRAFWERFPAERKLKLFTGAMHVGAPLNREMVGDWDLRTVSELYAFLPSVREATAIELVTPIYAPERAWERMAQPREQQGGRTREAFLEEYRGHIAKQLEGCNAIVIASPDVNPVTEYLLHDIYNVQSPAAAFEDAKDGGQFNGFVAIKEVKETGSRERFPRLFYREEQQANGGGPRLARGFRRHAEGTLLAPRSGLMQEYWSQDEAIEEFKLLGHLVVAKRAGGEMVVLLNGVSGPATFALAQILTGGGPQASSETNRDAEKLLEEINRALDNKEKAPDGKRGAGVSSYVQGIVEVVVKAKDIAKAGYLDSRVPVQWKFLDGEHP